MKTLSEFREQARAFMLSAPIPDRLHASTNSKVDKGGRKISFGILAHMTCPGRTEFCRACYVPNAYRYKAVPGFLARNTRLLFSLQHGPDPIRTMTGALTAMIRESHAEKGGQFRIHWSGDLFSREYAAAWLDTVRAFPGVRFWTYTRSFPILRDVLEERGKPRNLAILISADKHNLGLARSYAAVLGLPLAYAGSEQERKTDRIRFPLCPALSGASPDCLACGACQRGKPVYFSTHR